MLQPGQDAARAVWKSPANTRHIPVHAHPRVCQADSDRCQGSGAHHMSVGVRQGGRLVTEVMALFQKDVSEDCFMECPNGGKGRSGGRSGLLCDSCHTHGSGLPM